MKDLSLHLLDILENSAKAGATRIQVELTAKESKFSLRIKDNGPGLPPEIESDPTDPFRTSRTDRKVGLGLSLLKRAAEQTGESLEIASTRGAGVDILAWFNFKHVDAKPLGSLTEAFCTAAMAWPDVDLYVIQQLDGCEPKCILDTAVIKMELDGVPINAPPVRKYLISTVKEALEPLQKWAENVASQDLTAGQK